jgi:hypothetical protein
MKLTDPTHGLKHTPLEAVALQGETLDAHRDFWDRSARVDSRNAIAADSDEASFQASGRAEAEALRRFVRPGDAVLDIGCSAATRSGWSWCWPLRTCAAGRRSCCWRATSGSPSPRPCGTDCCMWPPASSATLAA